MKGCPWPRQPSIPCFRQRPPSLTLSVKTSFAKEMDHELPSLFVAGIPGCGKSHFGRWLAEAHGYLHIDFEKDQGELLSGMGSELHRFVDFRDPIPLVDRLLNKGLPVAFNWGFPVGCLDIASTIGARLFPVWFFASPSIARQSFVERGDRPLEAFDRQMVDINQHVFSLDSVFGGCTIQTIGDDATKKPCEQIFREITLRWEYRRSLPAASSSRRHSTKHQPH